MRAACDAVTAPGATTLTGPSWRSAERGDAGRTAASSWCSTENGGSPSGLERDRRQAQVAAERAREVRPDERGEPQRWSPGRPRGRPPSMQTRSAWSSEWPNGRGRVGAHVLVGADRAPAGGARRPRCRSGRRCARATPRRRRRPTAAMRARRGALDGGPAGCCGRRARRRRGARRAVGAKSWTSRSARVAVAGIDPVELGPVSRRRGGSMSRPSTASTVGVGLELVGHARPQLAAHARDQDPHRRDRSAWDRA